jgi:exopolysaccharide biosynthesis polyprenyl glycosylphosphotransferase
MLKQYARFIDLGVRLFDLVVLALALPAAHLGYTHLSWARGELPRLDRLWVAIVPVLILWIAAAGSSQVYGAYRTRTLPWEIGRLGRALLVAGLGGIACLFLLDVELPRLFVGLYFASAFATLALGRTVVRMAARALRRRGYNTRTYAVVGAGDAAEGLVRTFASRPHWGFRLAGFILPDECAVRPPEGKVLGTLDHLGRILDDEVLDEIVFAVPREQLSGIESAVRMCEEQGVAVLVSLEPLRLASGRMSLFEVSDLPMLVFTRTPCDVLALAAKRVFDLAVSTAILVALAPLFVAVAIAIKLESAGPVFFRQVRVGLNGRPFRIVKFRSMFADAEARQAALLARNEMDGPVFKIRSDPRITAVGRFIRKTSIDELPQFWNVLRGEMSIVGPRPPIPAEVRQYQRWQRRRLSVRPGITCTWQVSGRNGISFDRWMELDLEYIDNWSLGRDMQIFLKTIPAVLSTRGAS